MRESLETQENMDVFADNIYARAWKDNVDETKATSEDDPTTPKTRTHRFYHSPVTHTKEEIDAFFQSAHDGDDSDDSSSGLGPPETPLPKPSPYSVDSLEARTERLSDYAEDDMSEVTPTPPQQSVDPVAEDDASPGISPVNKVDLEFPECWDEEDSESDMEIATDSQDKVVSEEVCDKVA